MKLYGQQTPPERVIYGTLSSPAGKLAVALTEKQQACRVAFLSQTALTTVLDQWRDEWSQTIFTRGADLKDFPDLPVLLVGSEFQRSVWRIIAQIPSGGVLTYGDIADRLKKPKAFRAVGGACGANPVPYLVPCHRVVAANGGLGGFSGGLDIKKKLLKAEGYL